MTSTQPIEERSNQSSRASGPVPRAEPRPAMISLRGVSKSWRRGAEPVEVLSNLDVDIREGAFEALMGPSGSGKSTLLNLIGGLDRPSQGTCVVAGQDLTRMSSGELAQFRARHIGFVFQSYHLIPVLTALENVELPLLVTRISGADRKKRARTALRIVGLEDRERHLPKQLSGGQEQRVAIARAFVTDPSILLADEPTGDLDRKSADEILALLETLNREMGKTIFMVTHDPLAAARASIVRRLDKGKLQ
jgi:putative ABC transport system ATP-binding protein